MKIIKIRYNRCNDDVEINKKIIGELFFRVKYNFNFICGVSWEVLLEEFSLCLIKKDVFIFWELFLMRKVLLCLYFI